MCFSLKKNLNGSVGLDMKCVGEREMWFVNCVFVSCTCANTNCSWLLACLETTWLHFNTQGQLPQFISLSGFLRSSVETDQHILNNVGCVRIFQPRTRGCYIALKK